MNVLKRVGWNRTACQIAIQIGTEGLHPHDSKDCNRQHARDPGVIDAGGRAGAILANRVHHDRGELGHANRHAKTQDDEGQ